MVPILIIGYGNPLRTDDGIGWRAARSLLAQWPAPRVRIETAHQLLPEMADWIADADYVIFIDACWDSVPGRIRSHAVHREETNTASMTHHFLPEGLLADSWHLFRHCPEAIMVSVGGASFDHGEGLSQSVKAVFPALLTKIKMLVQKRLTKPDTRKVNSYA